MQVLITSYLLFKFQLLMILIEVANIPGDNIRMINFLAFNGFQPVSCAVQAMFDAIHSLTNSYVRISRFFFVHYFFILKLLCLFVD